MAARKWIIVSSQISLFIINLIVLAFGAVAIGVGIWAAVSDRDYLRISEDNTNYSAIGVLLVIVGFFILIVGSIGFIGVLCGSRLVGRILMIVYAVILLIVIIMVLVGAILGYVKRDDLKDTFRDDARKTLEATPGREDYREAWDDAQREVQCCGVDSYTDWGNITWFNNNTRDAVPLSCCAQVGGCGNISFLMISPNGGIVGNIPVWTEGCVDAIVDEVSSQIGAVAGVSITIGILMIAALVMACLIGILHRAESYEMV